MIVLLIFFIFLLSFSLYSRKYANPYKLIFIFGKKGSGKSCKMVHDMIKDLKRGWHVYSDMPVNIDGVRIINASDLATFRPEYHSAVYLDEVGISFDNREYKNFSTGMRDFFKLQRKYKVKVVMNSQAYDVDKKIRDVTDSMFLQSNIGNVISVSRPIKRVVTLVEAQGNSESRIADNLKFTSIFSWKFYFMPRYFKYFNSFDAPSRPLIKFSSPVNPVKRKSASRSLRSLVRKEKE